MIFCSRISFKVTGKQRIHVKSAESFRDRERKEDFVYFATEEEALAASGCKVCLDYVLKFSLLF